MKHLFASQNRERIILHVHWPLGNLKKITSATLDDLRLPKFEVPMCEWVGHSNIGTIQTSAITIAIAMADV